MATETYSYTIPNAVALSEGDILENSYGLPTIKVLGVGGGGCNAVSRMHEERVPGVEYVVINTDQQHLSRSQVPNKIALGPRLSRGLGGGQPRERSRFRRGEPRGTLGVGERVRYGVHCCRDGRWDWNRSCPGDR